MSQYVEVIFLNFNGTDFLGVGIVHGSFLYPEGTIEPRAFLFTFLGWGLAWDDYYLSNSHRFMIFRILCPKHTF